MKNLSNQHLTIILEQIEIAAAHHHRNPRDITLIAVSKNQSMASIESLALAGQRHFGENRIQEALEKKVQLSHELSLEWHFIGHLQSNKIQPCLEWFHWIHSVDSIKLIPQLEKRCAFLQKQQKILFQVNLSQEPSKSGFLTWDSLCYATETLLQGHCLDLRGLMMIGTQGAKEAESRQRFAQLALWRERLATQFGLTHSCTELSMGMSDDFPWAIAEGATFLRLGRALFPQQSSTLIPS